MAPVESEPERGRPFDTTAPLWFQKNRFVYYNGSLTTAPPASEDWRRARTSS